MIAKVLMSKSSSMDSHGSQQGFSLIETVIALGLLTAIAGGVALKMDSIKSHMEQTEQIMALDNFERQLIDLFIDFETIKHSVRFSSNNSLKNCFFSETSPCQDNQRYGVNIRLEGTREALTGPQVYYDRMGNRCAAKCEGMRVITSIIVRCSVGTSCPQPDHVVVQYDLVKTGDDKILRQDFIEANQFNEGKFPNINISCPSQDQILRGIGIKGQPLCVSRNTVSFVDDKGGKLKGQIDVQPKDCTAFNQDQNKDQYFISGISKTGELLCGERFW